MTALPADPQADEPLIPMPALTPGALRTAVENLTPSRTPTFISDLVDKARTEAGEQAGTGVWAGDDIEPTEGERAEIDAILGHPPAGEHDTCGRGEEAS